MNPSYQHLAEPIQIGAMRLRNRVFFPGHGTGLPVDNVPSDAHIAYLRKRAQGGVSLIVTEIAQVEERAIYSAQALRIVSDSQIEAYSKLADYSRRRLTGIGSTISPGTRDACST